MEGNEYHAINSEKTIFMNCDGKDFIMHGIFVDDMNHVPTEQYLLEEFLRIILGISKSLEVIIS